MKAPKVIAEIGCNHKGNMDIAKEMIHVAAHFCKVDVVKFQKRHTKELLSEEDYNAPHPNPAHAYGQRHDLEAVIVEGYNTDPLFEPRQYVMPPVSLSRLLAPDCWGGLASRLLMPLVKWGCPRAGEQLYAVLRPKLPAPCQ